MHLAIAGRGGFHVTRLVKKGVLLVSICLLIIGATTPVWAASQTLEQGVAQYREENFEEAVELLKKAREEDPGSSLAAFYLGLAYKQSGEYRPAVEQFRAALQLTPPVLDAYVELADVLYTVGKLKEAMATLQVADEKKVKPASVAFLKGLVFAAQGKDDEALDAFTKARELDKSLAQAVELQTVVILAKEHRLKKARESLKALVAIDPTSEIASLAREYDQSFSRIIAGHKTWRGSVGLNYMYDDNAVSRPSTEISGVEISGEEDHAFVGSFRLEYAPLLDGPWGFVAQYALLSTTYGSNDTHDTILQSFSLLPTYTFSRGSLTIPLSYNHILLQQDNYMGVVSLRPTLSYLLGIGHITQMSIGYAHREMLQAPLDPDEDRDSDIFSLGTGYLIPFANGKGMTSLSYEFSYDNAAGNNWVNQGHRFSLGLLVPLNDRLSFNLNCDVFLQGYVNNHTLFGHVKRNDTIYTTSSGISWELVKDLNVNLQYSLTRADSNLAIYDYWRNTFTTGFEYAF